MIIQQTGRWLALAACAALAACSSGSRSTPPGRTPGATATGHLIDSAVGGLPYTSGTGSAVTGADGAFTYEVGQPVTFTLGGIVLGTVAGKAIVTPVDLVGATGTAPEADPRVVKITQFLLMLDQDHDPANGITVPAGAAAAAAGKTIDWASATDDQLVAVLTSITGSAPTLVPAGDALAHVHDSILGLYAGRWNGTWAVAGQPAGAFTLEIEVAGTVAGTWITAAESGTWTGRLQTDGTVTLVDPSDGSTVLATLDIASAALAGTATNAAHGTTATFTGARITGTAAAPTFTPAGGSYQAAQDVAIATASTGAFIRYTTDGSTPTPVHGTAYAGPVHLATSGTLKAVAYRVGLETSPVTVAAYVFGASTATWTPVSGATNLPYAVWGSGPSDVWAGGFQGSLVHWDGSAWASVPSHVPPGTAINGLWASSPTDAWAAVSGAAGGLMHWDGTVWSTVAVPGSPPLTAVWGTSPADLWAVGPSGVIVHRAGATWSTVPSHTTQGLQHVWGAAADDVWAVGWNGTALHWDGALWSTIATGTTDSLMGVHGTSSSDVWIAGYDGSGTTGRLLHWDGATITDVDLGITTDFFYGVWANAPDDVWVCGYQGWMGHWDGTSWTRVSAGVGADDALFAIWGSAPNDVWAVGGDFTDGRFVLTHYWYQGIPHAISGTVAGDVQDGVLVTLAGPSGVSTTTTAGGGHYAFAGVLPGTYTVTPSRRGYSFAPSHWTVGVGAADVAGRDFAATALPPGWSVATTSAPQYLQYLWGSSASDVWATGYATTTAYHWDGASWTAVSTSPVKVNRLWGAAADDVWGTTTTPYQAGASMAHWDGHVWTTVATGSPMSASALWGTAASDVWAVGFPPPAGGSGNAAHYDGTHWTPLAVGSTTVYLSAVGGTASNDVWAGGGVQNLNVGVLYHYDGASWSAPHAVPRNVTAIWAAASDDVWAARQGGFYHWNGSAWSSVDVTAMDVYDMIGFAANDIWAVGTNGKILHYTGAWSWEADPRGPSAYLTGIWGTSANDLWAVDMQGSLLHRN